MVGIIIGGRKLTDGALKKKVGANLEGREIPSTRKEPIGRVRERGKR